MNKIFKLTITGSIAVLSFGVIATSCSQMDLMDGNASDAPIIIASTAKGAVSRTVVDGDIDGNDGIAGLLWTDGDELGVFGSSGSQYRYVKAIAGTQAKCAFRPSGDGVFSPVYAYYPYISANDGMNVTLLGGEIPSTQPMDDGTISGDYKYGTANGASADGIEFEFRHIFTLVKVDVDASGTVLAGETLKSVEIAATRENEPVNITGDFTFDATRGTYTIGADLHNTLKMWWDKGVALDRTVTGYISLFPLINKGDKLTFTVTTDRHVAKFSVASKIDFKSENVYYFPVKLEGKENLVITSAGDRPASGSFICATYNIDGLPVFNSDGPGADGTTKLAQRINSDNKWDFFCVSEDFGYDEQLTSALSNYAHGTFRGSVGMAQLTQTADTDGLNMFWKKTTGVNVTDETFVEYNDKEGGLTGGANTCIKKGFRYYLVTLDDGTEIDVYITHMNTFSGDDISEKNKYVAAVHSQLKQVRDYIIGNMKKNKRPAIFMGDTNMRYTRHKLQEYFMDAINNMSGFSVEDPWVSLAWANDFSSVGGGKYPLYGSKSLMVSDATGTNADSDVIISEADGGLQKGEIVDKIFCINWTENPIRIKAKSYLRDISFKKNDGKPLADHYPVVVEFEYSSL